MAFGNELNDFVNGFVKGYSWMEDREEKKLDREERRADRADRKAERAEDRKDRRDRWAVEDAYRDKTFDYNVSRDKYNDDWRESGRVREWDRQDQQDARQREMDEITVDRWGRADERSERELGLREREIEYEENERKMRRAKELGEGAIPEVGPDANPLPGPTRRAIPEEGGEGQGEVTGDAGNDRLGTANPLLQSTSWMPGGGSAWKPSSGKRTARGTMGMAGPDIAQAMVYDLNRDFGMPLEIGQGVVGQLAGETGGFKYHQEISPLVKGSRGGGGYAQWTGPRRRQFEAFAEAKGLDPRSYEANYGFLRHELANTSEGKIMGKLKGARNAIEAGRIFTGSAASRSGFLRPGIVNTAGRDRWTNRVSGLFGGGQRQVRAARGGMIEEQPALPFDEDDPLGNEYEGIDPEAAGGDEEVMGGAGDDTLGAVPTPTPAPRGAIPDPEYDGEGVSNDTPKETPKGLKAAYKAGREAVRDGLNKMVKDNQLDRQEAISDPALEKQRQDYLKGYGAAPVQMMRRVADMIDPEKKMTPAQRNMAALGNVYNFYRDRGEFDKAQAAAASMIQAHRQSAQQFLALSQAAAQEGRLDDASKAMLAAYTNVPNGVDLSIKKEGEGYKIEFTDAETGEQMEQAILSPDQFAEQVMKFTPGSFDQAILDAAAVAPKEYTKLKGDALESVSTNVRSYMEDNEKIAALRPEKQSAIRTAATDIASYEENGIPAADAVDILTQAISVDATAKPEDRKPLFKIQPERGNPGLVRVTTFLGDTFVVSKGTATRLTKMAGENEVAKQGEETKGKQAQDNSEYRMGRIRKFMGAVEAHGQDMREANTDRKTRVEEQNEERRRRVEAEYRAIPE